MIRVDYPFGILVPSILFWSMLAASSPYAAPQQQSSPPSVSNQHSGEQILMTVTVTDERSRVIGNLAKDRFIVLDGKIPQQVSFFEEKDVPVSVGFLLDFSGSMTLKLWNKDRLSAIREGLVRFIQQSHPSNEYFILTFADVPEVVTDWTRDKAKIGETLNKLAMRVQKGATAFYDACYLGVEKLTPASNPKRVLILITDGSDNMSRHSYEDLRKALRQSQAIIYSVFIESTLPDPRGEFGRGVLREITSNSGGVALSTFDNTGVGGALLMIAVQLRHQYTIGFKPTSPDGRWHTLKVRLEPDEIEDTSKPGKPRRVSIKARTRQGYFASLNR